MIRVLLVDDSALIRAMLKQVFQEDRRFQLAGEAGNGKEAVDKAREGGVDLIVMDINMPVMDGIEATRRICAFSPAAIIMFTTEDTMDSIYRSISAGAMEVLQKPRIADMTEEMLKDFREKIYTISQTRKDKAGLLPEAGQTPSSERQGGKSRSWGGGTKDMAKAAQDAGIPRKDYAILFIGSSTGGPSAIQSLLTQLPERFPLPIMITQHIDKLFDRQLVRWLDDTTAFAVSLAKDGEIPERGHVYIAPAETHLLVRRAGGQYRMELNDDPPLHFLKPSVDKMFASAAESVRSRTLSVILTGMGKDGAEGARAIRQAGGCTIAQDEQSCIVFGMPKAAIEAGAAQAVLPLDRMGQALMAATGMAEL